MKKTLGFSLLEILCALAIGMIVILTLVEVFLSYQEQFKLHQAISDMQENARFVSQIFKSQLSLAGNIGCSALTKDFPIEQSGVNSFDEIHYGNTLQAFDVKNWKAYLPLNFKLKPQGDNDIILARFVSLDNSRLLEPSSHTNQIKIDLHPSFEKGEYIAISDCQQMTLSRIASVYRSNLYHYQQLTLSNHLIQAFTENSEVGELKAVLFVIQKTARKNKSGEFIDALYELDGTGHKTELVDDISALRVKCFERVSSGAVLALNPDQVSDWQQVRLLKIYLLLESEDEVLRVSKSYQFYDKQYWAKDKRLYQEIIIYISIGR